MEIYILGASIGTFFLAVACIAWLLQRTLPAIMLIECEQFLDMMLVTSLSLSIGFFLGGLVVSWL